MQLDPGYLLQNAFAVDSVCWHGEWAVGGFGWNTGWRCLILFGFQGGELFLQFLHLLRKKTDCLLVSQIRILSVRCSRQHQNK